MYKKEHVVHLLQKIKQTLERIIANSKEIDSYQYYYLTPAGMERLESTCMLLIGAPLQAACESQQKLAESTLEFMTQIGFKDVHKNKQDASN